MKNNLETTNLHSEEVNDILNKIPGKVTRWGALIISVLIILMLCSTAFINYPDIISSEITITAINPPIRLNAGTDGKIETLFVHDKDSVVSGQYLACIGNAADYQNMMQLKQWMDSVKIAENITIPVQSDLLLGDLQNSWNELVSVFNEYQNQQNIQYFDKKITSVNEQLIHYNEYLLNVKKQAQSANSELDIFYKQYQRDSLLFQKNVISEAALDNSRASYYQKKSSTQNSNSLISQTQLKISECEQGLIDLQLEKSKESSGFVSRIGEIVNRLKSEFSQWELKYVIKSPLHGNVSFSQQLVLNYPVKANDLLCTIVPDNETNYIGKALLPISGSGKVCENDKVIIKPANFPYIDYGIIYGKVLSVSLMPQDNFYQIEISLPDGLTTSYGKKLNSSGEIQGKAEIITENQSLLNRLIKPVYALIKSD
ncbi:MAG: hypothetical protein A2033_12795 [Bacteroidetes bacterium GWA2_31_9]|nr:MAG: hypothetical protein A2033_12795 [Bacteroidetes bacterium GWA2_31_9]